MAVLPSAKSLASAVAALRKEEIIPEVVSEFEAKTTLAINYGNYNNAFLGNHLTVASKIVDSNFEIVRVKTLMTDPDAPSRKFPKLREYLHWVVSNIPAPAPGQPADLAKGVVLSPYMGPAPPSETDLHRYTFLLYKQSAAPTVVNTETLYTRLPEKRHRFKARDFAARAGLELVGANFFQAENTSPASRL
ncbi:hypothetical protein BG006_005323 [Podila minutissima]|uniref:Phosphatidylethanolamine-binding protein n=1 Tax=Podila minutissima TaxID=64525 RepID=A0A9P5STR9_9FUNG|nr:hypothetical protein BG006_005323 [Podila minutissima]